MTENSLFNIVPEDIRILSQCICFLPDAYKLDDKFYSYFAREEDRIFLLVLVAFYEAKREILPDFHSWKLYLDYLIDNKKITISDYLYDVVTKRAYVVYRDYENIRNNTEGKKVFLEVLNRIIIKGKLHKKVKEVVNKYRENRIEELASDFNIKTTQEKKRIYTIDDFFALERPVRGIVCPTGYTYLDHFMDNGLGLRELGLIVSAPGVGKSTLLMNILCNGFLEYYYNVEKNPISEKFRFVYVSLELSFEEVWVRLLSILFDLELKYLRENAPRSVYEYITFIGKEDVVKAMKDRIYVLYFEPFTPIDEILKELNNIDDGLLYVFIDYLNEIDEPKVREIYAKYETIMTKLDGYANTRECGIWIASQGHPKQRKEGIVDMKDIYQSKVGISKKISFGIGISANENNEHIVSFFKNRLKGKVHDTCRFFKNMNSLKLTEEPKIFTDEGFFSQLGGIGIREQKIKDDNEGNNIPSLGEVNFVEL